eukprot:comp23029_c5_seq2/m.36810 comp23029_c5_seq2/g.36810  ORF comp23029_c5_seq2/g.36810 comp23029_c5_seq2/m.36810 type:complete len:522 (-) comp23029_c5_seq2:609-2174(-)
MSFDKFLRVVGGGVRRMFDSAVNLSVPLFRSTDSLTDVSSVACTRNSEMRHHRTRSRSPPRSRSQPRPKERDRYRDWDRNRDREREWERQRDRERDRERDRDRDRERDRNRDRSPERERRRSRDRTREKERDRARDSGREKERGHGKKRDGERSSHSGKEKRKSRDHKEKSGRGDDVDGHLIIRKGDIIHDEYKVTSTLGEGTFGKVVGCKHVQTGKVVAVKVIRNVEKYRSAAEVEIDILEKLKKKDPDNKNQIIQLLSWFEHQQHVCMVFDLLGLSIFDFLKQNDFHPFPVDQIQIITYQLIRAIKFMHSIKLTHTDLKPENILFIRDDSNDVMVKDKDGVGVCIQRLRQVDIQLIDLGSATWEDQHHTRIVSTRHYRAPEVILEIPWSYPCDMWSVGCILAELYTGDALFQTHENMEHLAMMEAILGKIPAAMVHDARKKKYFKGDNLDWPDLASSEESVTFVTEQCQPLHKLNLQPDDPLTCQLFDLIQKLLAYDPKKRLTAEEAMRHEFVRGGAGR